MRRTKTLAAKIKSADAETGEFSAIVSVFNNVDLHGDRILPGAFADSLAAWQKSGDPIPVVWSHMWHDLDAHIGHVDPAKARELEPGDPDLPESLADLGGLYVDGVLDVSESGGRKAAKLLASRRVNQFSFAYDVRDEGEGDDGANELRRLDLLELGPTLLGANPATTLVDAKAADLAAALEAGTVELGDLVALGDELKAVLGAELAKVAGVSDGNRRSKVGARNSAKDAERIQAAHDLLADLGAKCAEPEGDDDGKGAEGGGDPEPEGDDDGEKARFSDPAAVAAIVALEREHAIP